VLSIEDNPLAQTVASSQPVPTFFLRFGRSNGKGFCASSFSNFSSLVSYCRRAYCTLIIETILFPLLFSLVCASCSLWIFGLHLSRFPDLYALSLIVKTYLSVCLCIWSLRWASTFPLCGAPFRATVDGLPCFLPVTAGYFGLPDLPTP